MARLIRERAPRSARAVAALAGIGLMLGLSACVLSERQPIEEAAAAPAVGGLSPAAAPPPGDPTAARSSQNARVAMAVPLPPTPTGVVPTPTAILRRPAELIEPPDAATRQALATLDASFEALYRRDRAAFEATFSEAGRAGLALSLWETRLGAQRWRASLASADPFPAAARSDERLARLDFEVTPYGETPRRSQGILRLVAAGHDFLIDSVEAGSAACSGALPWAGPGGGVSQRALVHVDGMLRAWESDDRAAFDGYFAETARGTLGNQLWQLRERTTRRRASLAIEDPIRKLGDELVGGQPAARAVVQVRFELTRPDGRLERQWYDLREYALAADFLIDGAYRVMY